MNDKPVKTYLVLSDLHVGGGGRLPDGEPAPHEDFFDDARFAELLDHYAARPDGPLELVLNGDIFDTLQIQVDGQFPDAITSEIAVRQIELIVESHPVFFDALGRFGARPDTAISYVQGNHDAALVFPEAGAVIERRIGAPFRYRGLRFVADGIWFEHGQQYEAATKFEEDRLVLERWLDKPVVGLPWGSLFVLRVLNRIKLSNPLLDKVIPLRRYVRWSFFFDPIFSLRLSVSAIAFFLFTRLTFSRRRSSRIGTTIAMVREALRHTNHLREATRIAHRHADIRAVVFGHTHEQMLRRLPRDRVYINTGTWMEVVRLGLATAETFRRRPFARIDVYEGGHLAAHLLNWFGVWQVEGELHEQFYV